MKTLEIWWNMTPSSPSISSALLPISSILSIQAWQVCISDLNGIIQEVSSSLLEKVAYRWYTTSNLFEKPRNGADRKHPRSRNSICTCDCKYTFGMFRPSFLGSAFPATITARGFLRQLSIKVGPPIALEVKEVERYDGYERWWMHAPNDPNVALCGIHFKPGKVIWGVIHWQHRLAWPRKI